MLRKSLSVIPFVLLIGAASAYAGQAERDFIEAEVTPAVKAAEAAYKSACTGDLKIDVKLDSYKNVDELRQVRYLAEKISESAPTYCKDATTQAAMSKLQVLEVSKAVQVTVDFAGNKATVTTDDSSYPSWEMLTAAVDK